MSPALYKNWLLICMICVLCMVTIGGYTRLTNSGLSITEWRPVTGVLPPISESAWQEELEKYKKTPEFKHRNFNISLHEFKAIYLIEYFHRLFGRFTGLVFIIPFLYFIFSNKINKNSKFLLLFALILGFVQGFMGWYMVKSGLVDNPHVHPVRLAAHLILATIIFSILCYEFQPKNKIKTCEQNKIPMQILFFLIILQIAIGAIVAGLKAGLIYNTFPKIDGKFLPDGLFILKPFWLNFIQDHLTVQFLHRINGFIILLFVLILTLWNFYKKDKIRIYFLYLLMIIVVQILVGIITLIFQVPIFLALIHQFFAFALLSFSIFIAKNIESTTIK